MNKLTSFLAIAASASIASAAVIVSEPFDYTVDSNIGTVAATGIGLTGNWQRTFTDTASAILRTYAATWDVPSNYGFTPGDTRISTPVDQNNSAAVNIASAGHINFDQDGVVYYSYLLKYGADNRSRVSFGSSSAVDLMRVQGIADGSLRVYAGGEFSQGGGIAGNSDYLVVGRITTSAAGNDVHSVWVYGSSDSIDSDDTGIAYAAKSGAITGTASMLQFSNVINASYGEFRMGTTWEDVTAVPEPATFALLAGFATLGLILMRRRRQ